MRPGEAGAAVELQGYLGGRLNRTQQGVPGDFIFESGPYAGKRVDFMLTPGSVEQTAKINQFFERNLSGFSKQLNGHLAKVDFVPMDARFLTPKSDKILLDLINRLPKE